MDDNADHTSAATDLAEATAGVPDVSPTEIAELAWSSEAETEEAEGRSWSSEVRETENDAAGGVRWRWRLRWAGLVVLVCVMALVTGWLSLALYREDFTHPIPNARPATVKSAPQSASAPTPTNSVPIPPPPPARYEIPPAPPPQVQPNTPDADRVVNSAGGFSFVIPAGWVESDATRLDYGSALLSKQIRPAEPGRPPLVANDTRIVLGRLDQTLYASAEPDNLKAATRLASDMGEFFMPYPGTRINEESTPLKANGMAGSAFYYEVEFSDTSKPDGQLWTGVIGSTAPNAATASPPQRWFIVWLGTANDPVDKAAATTLAQSVRPWTRINNR
ncbi:MAG: alanine and proline-rich secreted protein Apa [Mycobacterium sp.]|uniref:alanine and proline-rich secreted protein Apa n=1 Tax=Mycobacterium sp. TaxID=1785 RepID=UPI00261938A1|nr:alanine and proline-rich secreted protein Apa [Mycobacterium sp.]MDI3314516.1 alanine and proline-rich secreted protein Apa [Mycobacterium sp.]